MAWSNNSVSALRAQATGSRHGRHSVSRGLDGRIGPTHPLAGLALADAARLSPAHDALRRLVLNPQAKATKVETRNGCERSSRETINHRAGVASRPSGGRSPDGEVSSRSLPTNSDTSCGGRAAAARLVHTQKVEGSSPSPATTSPPHPIRGHRASRPSLPSVAESPRKPGAYPYRYASGPWAVFLGVSSLNLPGSTHHAARPLGRL